MRDISIQMSQLSNECSVCTEQVKKTLTCLSCNYVCCIPCAQQYLLSTFTSQCMSCNHAWDEIFLRNTFPTTWIEKQYKAHRKQSLLNIEKSYMAETMPYVEDVVRTKHANETTSDQVTQLRQKLEQYKVQVEPLTNKLATLSGEALQKAVSRRNALADEMTKTESKIQRLSRNIVSQSRQLTATIRTSMMHTTISNSIEDSLASFGLEEKKEVYHTPCTNQACRGYLSKKWECGLCKKKVCKDCREDIQDGHMCQASTLASVQALQKDATPCPKCKEPISRINGCNHMFCPWCKTSFDYKTGKLIEESQNTNPHYIRWRQEQSLATSATSGPFATLRCQTVDATAREITRLLEASYYYMAENGGNLCAKALRQLIWSIISLISELRQKTQVQAYGPQHNRMARIKYMMKEYNEKELLRDAMKTKKKNDYEFQLGQLYSMMHDSLSDWIYNMSVWLQSRPEPHTLLLDPTTQMCAKLVQYFNEESRKLSIAFDYTVYAKIEPRVIKMDTHTAVDAVDPHNIQLQKQLWLSNPTVEEKWLSWTIFDPTKHFVTEYSEGKGKI